MISIFSLFVNFITFIGIVILLRMMSKQRKRLERLLTLWEKNMDMEMKKNRPTYDQADDYGGALAGHSEYKIGEQIPGTAGQILHISNGPGGQLYFIDNPTTGFPDVIPARDLHRDML